MEVYEEELSRRFEVNEDCVHLCRLGIKLYGSGFSWISLIYILFFINPIIFEVALQLSLL